MKDVELGPFGRDLPFKNSGQGVALARLPTACGSPAQLQECKDSPPLNPRLHAGNWPHPGSMNMQVAHGERE